MHLELLCCSHKPHVTNNVIRSSYKWNLNHNLTEKTRSSRTDAYMENHVAWTSVFISGKRTSLFNLLTDGHGEHMLSFSFLMLRVK